MQVEELVRKTTRPFERVDGGSVYPLRDRMKEVMWRKAGLVRNREQLDSSTDWNQNAQVSFPLRANHVGLRPTESSVDRNYGICKK